MKNSFFTLIYFFLCPTLWAQEFSNIDSACFDKKIIDYSIDASGSIFLSFEGGTITKFSDTLDSLLTFSPAKLGNTKLLESGNGLVIFAFYEFFQEYVLTDRFLARPTRTILSNSSIDYIDLASQSLDNNLWIIENSSYRLIKYNVVLNRIEFETALNTVVDFSNHDFTFIKEYQNQVFLVDKNSGIYIFDNLGNFSRSIAAKTEKCLFNKNKIIYLDNNQVVSIDLYTNIEERNPIPSADV